MADTVTANRAYFNDLASSYDSKYEKTLDQLTREIRLRKHIISQNLTDDEEVDQELGSSTPAAQKRSFRILDYASGTGLFTRALAPYTTQCVGVDISEKMVATYNTSAQNQGLSKDEMFAVEANLTSENNPNPQELSGDEFFNFDLAGVCLGFHHFDNPELAAKRLADRLRIGGVLVIIDFYPHGSPPGSHQSAHTVKHHGFSEQTMKEIFTVAGVAKNFRMEKLGSGIVFHHHDQTMKRDVFLARGEKP